MTLPTWDRDGEMKVTAGVLVGYQGLSYGLTWQNPNVSGESRPVRQR